MQPRWYALTTKTNLELSATSALRSKGYEAFLPTYRVRNNWSDRVKELDRPLFPGYTFCLFDALNRLPILITPGVCSVVGFGNEPAPIDEAEMESVRALVQSGLPVSPWPFLREGQRIRIVHGAFAGLEGIFIRHKQNCRLVVSISLLQRSIAAEIDGDWITPA